MQTTIDRLSGADDASISTAIGRLMALHERGAAGGQVLAACQDLMSATERELLRRERTMMASGEPDLAAQVRRHGDILLTLEDQIVELRRASQRLSPRFLRLIHSLLDTGLRPVMSDPARAAMRAA
jgi:hypothetical protein